MQGVAHVEEQELVARGPERGRRRRLVRLLLVLLSRSRGLAFRAAATAQPRRRQRDSRGPRGVEGHEAVGALADELVAALRGGEVGEGMVEKGGRGRRG